MNYIKFGVLGLILPLGISFFVNVYGYKVINKKYDKTYGMYVYGFSLTLFIALLSLIRILTPINQFSLEHIHYLGNSIFRSLFHRVGLVWFGASLVIPLLALSIESNRTVHTKDMISKREKKKMETQDPDKIPYDYDKNIFVCGKNGSGKTVAILNFIETHIENNEFCLVMDGKGDLGKYSLYDVVTKLAKKHKRPLYIVNQTKPHETHAYNPFQNCNATQITDMLINMSEWSEEHYKAQATEYWLDMVTFMIKFEPNVEINFNNLVAYSDPNYFNKRLSDKENYMVDNGYKDLYDSLSSSIGRNGATVRSAVSRFSVISKGVGQDLFASENTFDLEQAYDEKAIVLVILNSLVYSDFARSVGMLVLDDIKNLVGELGKRSDEEHKPFLMVYDELSVYFDPRMVDIINKARSVGGSSIISTQTIADMDIISEQARRQMIGNQHAFYVLKQADDLSAQVFADSIGTFKTTNITQVKKRGVGKSGLGTERIVDEYIINPNDLKKLPLEVGVWVDTQDSNEKVIRTRMNYVDVSDIKDWEFSKLPEQSEEKVTLLVDSSYLTLKRSDNTNDNSINDNTVYDLYMNNDLLYTKKVDELGVIEIHDIKEKENYKISKRKIPYVPTHEDLVFDTYFDEDKDHAILNAKSTFRLWNDENLNKFYGVSKESDMYEKY